MATATTGWLSAQTAPTGPTSGSSSRAGTDSEAAVELSPFTVTADKDLGYLAGNTLAGSRLNTQLKDTAASISVFTEEFMKGRELCCWVDKRAILAVGSSSEPASAATCSRPRISMAQDVTRARTSIC